MSALFLVVFSQPSALSGTQRQDTGQAENYSEPVEQTLCSYHVFLTMCKVGIYLYSAQDPTFFQLWNHDKKIQKSNSN